MSIEAGTYRGRGIAGSEQYGKTSNGNDQIVIDLELESGERVSTFLVFSDKAAKYSMDRLRALGWKGNDLTDLTGIDQNEVAVEVKYEEYQGEEKMKVQIRTGSGVVLKETLDANAKKAFGAKYKALAVRTPAVTATPAPPKVKPAPKPGAAQADFAPADDGGDEIPF